MQYTLFNHFIFYVMPMQTHTQQLVDIEIVSGVN